MIWHTSSIDQVFDELHSSRNGLSDDEVKQRTQQYGSNQLEEKKKKSPLLLFLLQFKDTMILILAAAAIVSGIAGDLKDAIVIVVIIFINAVVGFIQEYRAEKAMDALKKMSASHARVKRNNRVQQVSSSELVPGDIVLLEAGDMVPADLRMVKSNELKIEEASLTGESNAVTKSTEPLQQEDVPIGDRVNMAYKSTLVTAGKGGGIVVATGMKTEIGRIAQLMQEKESLTPLQQRLTDFSKKLSVAVLVICAVLFGVGLLRGEDPLKMLLTAISLAVAAIPEALPAVITIALAMGAKKMVRKNALIRKLAAVETLGSVTYICSDKTGTLTQNHMTVKDCWAPDNDPPQMDGFKSNEALLLAMALNHNAIKKKDDDQKYTGDPTEVALVEYALQHESYNQEWETKYPRKKELPFNSERKMMTTVHTFDKKFLVITKGAEESILEICVNAAVEEINKQSDAMAEKGQRVLAFSYKIMAEFSDKANHEELESDQQFCGLAGMIDPPRPEAQQAIAECKTAGIVPVLITGDHPVTAKAIAKEMGILSRPEEKVVPGTELEKYSDEELLNNITNIKVYARVSPEQKLRIVKALQQQEQFVAMTGDGVNDAPALKKANIGVAMGITGTDVSKEAAHMILLDDNFATIVKAIREGRRIYDNIRRFIRYVLGGNFAEILTIFIAPLVGLPIPLLPIHILWINLVTDSLPGLALANEPAEPKVMQRPPRKPVESIFAQGLGINVIWVGALMAGITLGTQAWALHVGDAHWQTMVFTVLCFSQLGHAMVSRNDTMSIYRLGLFSNRPMVGAIALMVMLQLAIIYIPVLNKIFATAPLTLEEMIICIVVSAIPFHAVELVKLFTKKR